MLHSVQAPARCQLMIMAWREIEGEHNFVFCGDGRVVDEKERDGGRRWERYGPNERLWEIRSMSCLIGLRRPRIGDITCRIRAPSATTPVSVRNTRVLRRALMALMEPCTLWRGNKRFLSPRRRVVLHSISKMYFSHWKPPGVSERMWSVNLDASISAEYQTLGGHSCRPWEQLAAPMTSLGAVTTSLGTPGSASDKRGSAGNLTGRTSNHSHVFSLNSHVCIYASI